MSEIILIGDLALDKNTVKAVVLTLLVITLLLVATYHKLGESDISLESMTYKDSNTTPFVSDAASDSDLAPIPAIKEGYTQLAFCPETCSVINATTKEVIKHYQKGSNNCVLLNYLFNNPNKHLTELDIASKVCPECPEKFYIRKAICNLKLDKSLSDQMFNKSETGVELNTLVKLPSSSSHQIMA
ncbi:hypothetical protein L4D09_00175 [Photobacterium makurazakiensis]|uniref:hypothetical protein n=1 Tax=Photobacterium makurazakiensis TaxID=2910234 RepID=UPI003D12FFCF